MGVRRVAASPGRDGARVRLISVNVGLPRPIALRGEEVVVSAIGKLPVAGPVPVRWSNLDGDRPADPSVHGGRDKAVYAYPSEHYPYWKARFPARELSWGAFGENFTTEGLQESELRLGTELEIGTARFAVAHPRTPCYKLGLAFGTDRMVRWFAEAGRPGFYLRVLQPGTVRAGDDIRRREGPRDRPTVLDTFEGP